MVQHLHFRILGFPLTQLDGWIMLDSAKVPQRRSAALSFGGHARIAGGDLLPNCMLCFSNLREDVRCARILWKYLLYVSINYK